MLIYPHNPFSIAAASPSEKLFIFGNTFGKINSPLMFTRPNPLTFTGAKSLLDEVVSSSGTAEIVGVWIGSSSAIV